MGRLLRLKNQVDKKIEDRAEIARLNALHNTSAAGIRHAAELGGIPAPSHALVRQGQQFDSFGDISLVAGRGMVDPQNGAHLFGADVYSRRQPPAKFKFNKAALSDEVGAVRRAMDELDDGYKWELQDWVERGNPSDIRPSDGMKLAYARANGIDVQIPKKITNEWVVGGVDSLNRTNTGAMLAWALDETGGDLGAAVKLAKAEYPQIDGHAGFDRLVDGAKTRGIEKVTSESIDKYALRDVFEKAGATSEAAQGWFEGMLKDSGAWSSPYFDDGRKKVAYTADNLSEYMNRKVRGAEQTMVEGLGKQRSKAVKKFKTIEEAKKYADTIVSKDQMDEFAKAGNERLFSLVDQVSSPYSSAFQKIDDMSAAVGDVMRGASPEVALRRHDLVPSSGFEGAVHKELRDLADSVKNGPTEYFESKYPGVAKLSEYSGAVVPDNTPEDVIAILQQNGLQVEKYADATSRAAARDKIPDSAFMVPAAIGTAALVGSEDAEAAPFGALAKLKGIPTREAYHGSPHDFDAFSMSKIGTGEGAQTYGHGLYFSSSEDIAKWYRNELSDGPAATYKGRPIDPMRSMDDFEQEALTGMFKYVVDEASPNLTKAELLRRTQKYLEDEFAGISDADWGAVIKRYGDQLDVKPGGALYRTEIPDESLMLDWNKPLRDQPAAIQQAFDSFRGTHPAIDNALDNPRTTGAGIYGTVEAAMPSRMDATVKLRELGVPGITYTGRTSGARNFVVFDDELINLVEKGAIDPKLLAGVGAMGAAGMAGQRMQEELPPLDPIYAEFANRRATKQPLWDQLREEVGVVRRPVTDRFRAGADVAADFVSAMVGPTLSAFPTLVNYMHGHSADEMRERRDALNEIVNYQPRTALGQEYSDNAAEATVSALAPLLHVGSKLTQPLHPLIRWAAEKTGEREKVAAEAVMDLLPF